MRLPCAGRGPGRVRRERRTRASAQDHPEAGGGAVQVKPVVAAAHEVIPALLPRAVRAAHIHGRGDALVAVERVPAQNLAGVHRRALLQVKVDVQGQVAAEVREKRPPEPYKGKGIKYTDEVIRRKEGKTGVKKK